jgi:hypothetical protein
VEHYFHQNQPKWNAKSIVAIEIDLAKKISVKLTAFSQRQKLDQPGLCRTKRLPNALLL